MRLVSASLEGFKRFERRSEVNLEPKLVAIVGPNECGKSSLLRALSLLSNPGDLTAKGDIQDTSRHSNLSSSHELVRARFAIEPGDRESLEGIDDADKLRWFTVALGVDGELRFDVEPCPQRNMKTRATASRLAKAAGSGKWARELLAESGAAMSERLARLGEALDSESAVLDDAVLDEILALASELPQDRPVTKTLLALDPIERSPAPNVEATQRLRRRVPQFLLFTEADRDLNSTYDLEAVAGAAPAALANICRLAGLDLRELWRCISEGLAAQAETMIDRANDQLRQTFTTKWSQAGVEVRLSTDGKVLRIFAGNRDTANGYVNIAERSDGLKWFVSLLAFLTERRSTVAPILLVDEAETHLHYDAQADLMQMLGRQTVAAKVIYTTHSAGCLPEDLGAGLRAIRPNASEERSDVVNWVWAGEGNLGLTPVLLAMGASALAFTPARLAVITEGPSDFILLPTLMREATGNQILGFQFAPGASEAGVTALASLERDAARVLYLTDGDDGGRGVRNKLTRHRVPADRIFGLPAGLTVEDLVKDQVYADAVNVELRRSYGDAVQIPRTTFPSRGRATFVESWCAEHKKAAPKKRAVAIQVLSHADAGKGVLKHSARKPLLRLFGELQNRFSDFPRSEDDVTGGV